ncbi:MAG: Hpt domain-containing protein [Thermoleophilia bacterium]
MSKTDDLTDFLPLFLAESREHLAVLAACAERLEQAPRDRDAAARAVRAARTLAGMADTMGFPRTASLCRALAGAVEPLVGSLGPDAVEALEACRGAVAGSLEAIGSTGRERLQPAALIARLAGLMPAAEPAAQEAAAPPAGALRGAG